MALLRKLFYWKPPEGLLEICEKVYVFDDCFTTDTLEEKNYKQYVGGVMTQLREHYPDASILVFNFRDADSQSHMANALSEYDMTIMEYPRQYEGCPLLPMEMIHHFLRSSESWLSLGLQNLLLTHCELGGWPILAFMLAALLIYRKQYSGEHKTLDMVHKQAPRELLHLLSPLNPIPSQLRYLQYVSRRNIAAEWPPLDRPLTMDCVIIRMIPNFDGEGGCRPIFRLYGQDPLLVSDRTPKVLFSTPKKSRVVRHFKQGECELVKIDINRHIQGDVVLECINLHDDMEREEMIFRVMFNTAFIRSNILMLNRDEIDILWDAKDQFPKEFRAEVIFSEMDAVSSAVPVDFSCFEEKDGLPLEAFAKVQEIFSSVDWLVPKGDAAGEALHLSLSNAVIEAYSHFEKPPENHHSSMVEYSAEILTNLTLDKQSNISPQLSSKVDVDKQATRQSNISPQLSSKVDIEERDEPLYPAYEIDKVNSFKLVPMHPEEQTVLSSTSPTLQFSNAKMLHLIHGKQLNSNIIQINDTGASPCLSETATVSSKPFPLTTPTPPMNDSCIGPSTKLDVQCGIDLPRGSPEIPSVSAPPSIDDTAIESNVSLSFTEGLVSGDKIIASGTLKLVPRPSAEDMVKATRVVFPPPLAPPPHSSSAADELNSGKIISPSGRGSPPPPPPPPPPLSSTVTLDVATEFAPHVPCPLNPHTKDPIKENLASTSSRTPSGDPRVEHSSSSFEAPFAPSSPVTPSSINNLATKSLPSQPLPPPPPPLVPSTENFSTPPPPGPISTLKETLGSVVAPPVQAPPRTPPVPASPRPPSPPRPLLPALPMMDGSTNRSASLLPPAPPPPPPMSPGESSVRGGPPRPPPPPLHSRQGQSSVALPPPPPPRPPTLDNPSIPSVLLPPLNSNKEAPKVTNPVSTATTGASGLSGSPSPPPPSNPPGTKGKSMLSRTVTSRNNQTKKLKPLHWLKLSRAVSGSLWAETQKSGEASKAPEIDISELESLFSAAVANPDQGGSGRKTSSRALPGNKSEKVQLVDHRRAYNCEIMLSKVKIPLHDLLSSVLSLEDSALDIDQVENLIKFCPTKEEMEMLKGYTGDKDNLGKCEQFFWALMQVPRIESKLRVFLFKIQFCSQVSDLRNNLNVVNSAADQIRGSSKLKRIMQTILSLGNALNQGTARGSAVGFRLDSLLKLTETRARNNKMTLMHYLCKVLADKLPDLLDFWQDLYNLEPASKIQLKFLAEEMQAISKGLEKVAQELSMSENDGPVSDKFRKALKEFLSFSEGEARSLASLYSGVGRNVDALILYFGEDPARCSFEQVISTLLNFVRMFKKSHEENCKQLELEKKKAEKEASNEKPNVAAIEKDSGNLNLSRVKSVK